METKASTTYLDFRPREQLSQGQSVLLIATDEKLLGWLVEERGRGPNPPACLYYHSDEDEYLNTTSLEMLAEDCLLNGRRVHRRVHGHRNKVFAFAEIETRGHNSAVGFGDLESHKRYLQRGLCCEQTLHREWPTGRSTWPSVLTFFVASYLYLQPPSARGCDTRETRQSGRYATGALLAARLELEDLDPDPYNLLQLQDLLDSGAELYYQVDDVPSPTTSPSVFDWIIVGWNWERVPNILHCVWTQHFSRILPSFTEFQRIINACTITPKGTVCDDCLVTDASQSGLWRWHKTLPSPSSKLKILGGRPSSKTSRRTSKNIRA